MSCKVFCFSDIKDDPKMWPPTLICRRPDCHIGRRVGICCLGLGRCKCRLSLIGGKCDQLSAIPIRYYECLIRYYWIQLKKVCVTCNQTTNHFAPLNCSHLFPHLISICQQQLSFALSFVADHTSQFSLASQKYKYLIQEK